MMIELFTSLKHNVTNILGSSQSSYKTMSIIGYATPKIN